LFLALVQGQFIAPKIYVNPAAFFAVAKRTPKDIRIEFYGIAEVASGNGKV
jgi:hypothetical protein